MQIALRAFKSLFIVHIFWFSVKIKEEKESL